MTPKSIPPELIEKFKTRINQSNISDNHKKELIIKLSESNKKRTPQYNKNINDFFSSRLDSNGLIINKKMSSKDIKSMQLSLPQQEALNMIKKKKNDFCFLTLSKSVFLEIIPHT